MLPALLLLILILLHQVGATNKRDTVDIAGTAVPTAIALLEEAITLYRNGDKREAAGLAERVIEAQPGYAHALNFLGVVRHDLGEPALALVAYERSVALNPEYAGAWSNMGLLLRQVGQVVRSREAFQRSLAIDPNAAIAHNGLGLAIHYLGDPAAAVPHYDRAIELDPNFAEAVYNRGVSLMHTGAVQRAAADYFHALELQPDYVEAMINLASVHHRHGTLEMARSYYEMALGVPDAAVDDRIMVHTNLGVTYVMEYDGEGALAHFGSARALLLLQREVLVGEASTASADQRKNTTERASWKDQKITLSSIDTELRANAAHFSRTRTALCDWELYWPRLFDMFASCDAEMAAGNQASLLPFDTLLLPTPSSSWTLRVARSHSIKWENSQIYTPLALDPVVMLPFSTRMAAASKLVKGGRLRFGYISHDFNDHPTAHMAEGLFVHHDRSRYAVSAYSYGKNDLSVFRARIEDAVESFVEMATLTFIESAQRIRDDQLHVLYDLQCHTRGNRIEIAAVKPAPIIVNYLIYPGPMGAAWIDYLVADAVVAPAERAHQSYLSKLLIMPATYQVNYYPREDYIRISEEGNQHLEGQRENADDDNTFEQQSQLRVQKPKRAAVDPRFEKAEEMDIDDPCMACAVANFVFCNFNKNDKLDPQSFTVWMNILRQVPGSILWMLAPSRAAGNGRAILRNLQREAAARGVAPARIVFAPRRTKRAHLERMRHADLFLDSFVYGAHSTATDALRGGLPVLTVRSENFASRVATSLLLNVGLPEMAVASVEVYERVAVMLARGAMLRGNKGRGLRRMRWISRSGLQRAEISGVLGALARRMTKRREVAKGAQAHPDIPPLGVNVSEQDAGAMLHVSNGGLPLFHIAHYTRAFERGAECMHEVKVARCDIATAAEASCKSNMHIIVGAKGMHTMTVERGWAFIATGGAEKSIFTAFEGAGKIELRTM